MLNFKISPRHFVGRQFTAYWEGFLSEDELNQILALPEWVASHDGGVMNNSGTVSVREDTRISKTGWWTANNETAHIWNKYADMVSNVNSQFFNFDLDGLYEAAQLTTYYGEQEGKYNWHIDYSLNVAMPRKLTVVTLLNDRSEFEGGEFQVKVANDDPIDLELKRGRAWVFPSYLLHRVAPVTKGVRKSLVMWVGGPDFK